MKQAVDSTAANTLASKLQGQTGQRYWRSLDDLANTEEFRSFVQAEFPAEAGRPSKGFFT